MRGGGIMGSVARLLLILPTGTYRADEYLAAADHLGLDVVIGSERAQALAATMGENFLELPLERPIDAAALVVSHARRSLRLDAVVAVDDQGVLTAALAARELGLRHSPPEAVALTRDKAAMRRAFEAAGVPQPDFVVASSGSGGEVAEAAERLGFPVVVKPCTLSASRGVIRADSAGEAVEAAARASSVLAGEGEPEAPLLVERFVPGPEVAVEGILSSGTPHIITIFDKPDPLDGPYFEESLYLSPTTLSPRLVEAVAATTAAALGALGLVEGPFHAELRLGAPGPSPVAMLEVAARTIGGRCSKAMVMEDGSSLEEVVLANALGLPMPAPRLASPCGILMVPIPRSGILRGVGGIEDARAVAGITGVEVTIPLGRVVRALPEGDRYLGFVFAAAARRGAVEEALRTAGGRLNVDIAPMGAGEASARTVQPVLAPRVR